MWARWFSHLTRPHANPWVQSLTEHKMKSSSDRQHKVGVPPFVVCKSDCIGISVVKRPNKHPSAWPLSSFVSKALKWKTKSLYYWVWVILGYFHSAYAAVSVSVYGQFTCSVHTHLNKCNGLSYTIKVSGLRLVHLAYRGALTGSCSPSLNSPSMLLLSDSLPASNRRRRRKHLKALHFD